MAKISQREQVDWFERRMSLAARVVEALWQMRASGPEVVMVDEIVKVTNGILDEMAGEFAGEVLMPQLTGTGMVNLMSHSLCFPIEFGFDGRAFIRWDEAEVCALARYFGVSKE